MSCKSIFTVFGLSVLLSLSGCASIVDKDTQKVEITTVPANCFITIKEKDGSITDLGKKYGGIKDTQS